MSRNVSINEMGDAIMEELEKYSKLATDDMKAAVKETAASVRKDIRPGPYCDSAGFGLRHDVAFLGEFSILEEFLSSVGDRAVMKMEVGRVSRLAKVILFKLVEMLDDAVYSLSLDEIEFQGVKALVFALLQGFDNAGRLGSAHRVHKQGGCAVVNEILKRLNRNVGIGDH